MNRYILELKNKIYSCLTFKFGYCKEDDYNQY